MTLMRFRRLATSTLLALGTSIHAYAVESFPALEKDKRVGVQVKIQNFSATDARQIKDAGFGFVRFGVWTNSLASPAYRTLISEAFAATKSADLPVLMTIRSTKALANSTSSSDLATAGETFANAIIDLENTYRTQLVAIEIWNEPDLPTYWPTGNFETTFVPFMSAVCNALQQHEHSTPVIGFGFARAPTKGSASTAALSKIVTDYPQCIRAVSYHPYGMSSTEISRAQTFISENFHLPGVISEWGVASLFMNGGTTGQASKLASFIKETHQLDIALTSIYEWKNNDSGSNDREKNFGLNTSDGQSKPAANAVQVILKSK
ncbi:cellulase family glycosylhydrolase [Pseudomonas sp. C2B4]|uniref:cellulase family glycosylhydrolase n=1 Tax=Pseudomonas sp. C2B4 TaxID=2735270 RepID=UPI001585D8DE|nr:cellulase family glycosylhydrolase [Pseudomonas sp. C2B4]